MARSVSISSQRGFAGYESDRSSDTAGEDESTEFPALPPTVWQAQRLARLSQQKLANEVIHVAELRPRRLTMQTRETDDGDSETHSRSSTLGDERELDYPEKTPTSLGPKQIFDSDREVSEPEPREEHRVIGPLEQQLSALMSKIVVMERENPTISVTPEDYQALQEKVKALEAEKATWTKRHEALFALRDEDVSNNIKIRGLLAKERREHAAMCKLRDDDLNNVLVLRSKLAEATRKLDRLERSGSLTPLGRPKSLALERRDTTDLFQVAKNVALEHRALELEKANQHLTSQIAALRQGMGAEDVSRVAAHTAWRDTVNDLQFKLKMKDEELSRVRSGSTGSTSSIDWSRIEAMHEENATYREKMAQRLQQLRSEKEMLQRDLHRREDENADLEARLSKLQRKAGAVAS